MLTGPPSQRGSVRPVTIDGDPTGRSYTCEVRSVSPRTGVQPGAIVSVEFGAAWATRGGRQVRIEGQWHQCIVLPAP